AHQRALHFSRRRRMADKILMCFRRVKHFIILLLICIAQPAASQTKEPPQQLKYVLIVTRHGVRAPTWTAERLNQYSTEKWPDWGVPPGNLTTHGRELMKIMGSFYREYFSSQKLLGNSNCADAERTYFWADTDQRTLESAKALAEGMFQGCAATVHSM